MFNDSIKMEMTYPSLIGWNVMENRDKDDHL